MIDNDNTDFDQLTEDEMIHVNRLCNEFEARWQRGEWVMIEDVLNNNQETLRPTLMRELLLLEIAYRRKVGIPVAMEQYASRFPTADKNWLATALQEAEEPRNLQVDHEEGIPLRLGDYSIVRRVGAGGMGSVYEARHDRMERIVAIKVLRPELAQAPQTMKRFAREIRAAASLSHPNIVTAYDSREEDGIVYLVTEFIDGMNLSEYVKQRGPLSVDEVIRIVVQAAKGLQYAHERGIVHRDVKPHNLMIQRKDHSGPVHIGTSATPDTQDSSSSNSQEAAYVKLLDLGLASLQGGEDFELTNNNMLMGTAAYISPEQVLRPKQVDQRADIYSLGCTMYYMLTGTPVYCGATVFETALAHTSQPVPSLQPLRPDAVAALDTVLAKMIAKEPNQRFQSMKEVISELQSVLSRRDNGESLTTLDFPKDSRAVAAALLGLTLVATSILAFILFKPTQPAVKIQSMAVLPFRTLNLAEGEEYLGLGIADSLITRLSHIRHLAVRPIGAVQSYSEDTVDPVATGRLLRVDVVLEGTIQRQGDRTRSTVRLLHVDSGKSLWATTIDQASTDLFAIQDEISRTVTSAMALELSADENRRLNRRHTENPKAHEAYLRARYHWNRRVSQGVEPAIEHYQQAIDLDPLYALAYAGLGEAYVLMNIYNYHKNPAWLKLGKAAAEHALSLDENLTEAHMTLAYVAFYHDLEWTKAESRFRRAIELNPNSATARQWYGEYLFWMGRFDESILEIDHASELDPLSPVIMSIRGSPYLLRRDYDRARQEYLKALDIFPDSRLALYGLAVCEERQSRYQEALTLYRKLQRPNTRVEGAASIAGEAVVYAMSGQTSEAQKILHRLVSTEEPRRVSPYLIATVYAALGEVDQAFGSLEAAYAERDDWIVWIHVDPKLDLLRADSRYQAFLQKIGFPQEIR